MFDGTVSCVDFMKLSQEIHPFIRDNPIICSWAQREARVSVPVGEGVVQHCSYGGVVVSALLVITVINQKGCSECGLLSIYW